MALLWLINSEGSWFIKELACFCLSLVHRNGSRVWPRVFALWYFHKNSSVSHLVGRSLFLCGFLLCDYGVTLIGERILDLDSWNESQRTGVFWKIECYSIVANVFISLGSVDTELMIFCLLNSKICTHAAVQKFVVCKISKYAFIWSNVTVKTWCYKRFLFFWAFYSSQDLEK